LGVYKPHLMNKLTRYLIPLLALSLIAAAPSRKNTYTAGEVISPTDVTENEDALFDYVQAGVDTYKANSISGGDIKTGTITNTNISSGTITAAELAANSVEASEIAANAVGASEIATDVVGTSEIAEADFGDWTCASDSCTLDAGVVDATAIATGGVAAAEILDDSILSAEFGDEDWGDVSVSSNSITLDAGVVDATAIATNGVDNAEIATDAVRAAEIQASAVGASEINDDSILSAEFGDEDWGDMSVATNSITLDAGVVDVNELAASITMADGDLIDFGSNVTGATEGIFLPAHATDCSTATAEGQVCWEEDVQALFVGNGSSAVRIGSAAIVNFGSSDNAFTTDFYCGGAGLCNASETAINEGFVVPSARTGQNLRCHWASGTGGQTWTATVRDDASDTTMTCVTATGGNTCADTVNTHSFVAGDLITVFMDATSGAMTSSAENACTFELL